MPLTIIFFQNGRILLEAVGQYLKNTNLTEYVFVLWVETQDTDKE
jgi:hypothetical protein